ncbi:MAG: hypothetical protein Q9227_003780 [Pyrenula ochraceoflavens]
MADKEATVYIVDLGWSMRQKHQGRDESDLDWYAWGHAICLGQDHYDRKFFSVGDQAFPDFQRSLQDERRPWLA